MQRFAAAALSVATAVAIAPSPSIPIAAARQDAPAEDRARSNALLQAAQGAIEAGDATRAEELFRAARDAASGSADAHVALGRFLYANGSTGEGLGLLWRATELDKQHVAAASALAEALLVDADYFAEQGDSANSDASNGRAYDVLQKIADQQDAQEVSVLTLRVKVLLRLDGKGEEAFALAFQLLEAHPDDLGLHALLVDAAALGKGFDAALAWYETATLEPWVTEWFAAGHLAARATWNFNNYVDDERAMADYVAAERRMVAVARLRPDYFEAATERISFYRSWSGWIRHRQDRLDEAFDLFVTAWGRDPANENAISGMFWICGRWYELGEMEKAREGYRQLCAIASDRAEFWNNYALICRDTGLYEESYRAYRKALALLPDDPRIVNDCALILQYHLKRDLDLAERWYIRAEDLARANFAQAENDGDDARVAEQRAILGDALVNLARLYGDQGRMAESAEHWNELREVEATREELPENGGR